MSETQSMIPEITDERLETLCKRIHPVVRFIKTATNELAQDKRGHPYYIEPVDPRKTSFVWNPVASKQAKGLVELGRIETYHTTGGFFHKPSVAEVIAQIPEQYLRKVVAFETGAGDIADNNRRYTSAMTILYQRGRT